MSCTCCQIGVVLSGCAETPCAPLAHGKVCGANAPLISPFRDVSVVCCVVFPCRLWLFFFLSILFFIFFFICFVFISICVVLLQCFFSLSFRKNNNGLWGTQGRAPFRHTTTDTTSRAQTNGHAKFYAATKACLRPCGVEPLLAGQQNRLL